jgi:hypothetical protein
MSIEQDVASKLKASPFKKIYTPLSMRGNLRHAKGPEKTM